MVGRELVRIKIEKGKRTTNSLISAIMNEQNPAFGFNESWDACFTLLSRGSFHWILQKRPFPFLMHRHLLTAQTYDNVKGYPLPYSFLCIHS